MINSSSVLIVPYESAVRDIAFESNYNDLILDQQKIHFSNGLNFTITPFSSAVRDVSINNNSLLMLAENVQVEKIFKEKTKSIKLEDLLKQSALFIELQDNDNYTNNYLNNNFINFLDKNDTPHIFKFKFVDDYVYITDFNNNALTDRDTFFYVTEFNNEDNQKFNYILSESSIILFKYKSNYQKVIVFNGFNPYYYDLSIDSNILPGSILYIESFKDLNLTPNSLVNSYVASYENNPLSSVNSIEINSNFKNKKYNQQYLFNLPYENQNNKIYINSLKNYQTANYNYLPNNTQARVYTSLFTGNNQHAGNDKVYLNFKSSTLEKIFECDKETVFRYPSTADINGIPLSSAGLIEDGAIAGKNPFTSDRISLYNIDYKEFNQSFKLPIVDGTWICSWLSAGDINSIWVDRYYVGKDIDSNLYERYYTVDSSPYIVDIPSRLKLLPNFVYKYFHQGQKNIQDYIKKFNIIDKDKSTLLLNITSWNNSLLLDISIHNNNGTLSYNTIELNKEFLKLDGTNYVIFPASSSLEENKQLTVGFWLNLDNWKEISGYQIFGNFANGGLGLFNKQIIPTSLITLYDNNNSYIYNYNSNISLISEQKDNKIFTQSSPVWVIRNIDQSYWLVDTRDFTAAKFDINNNKIYTIELNNLKNITQVEVDSNQNIYIVDNTLYKIVKINDFTGKLEYNQYEGINLPREFNRIEILQNYEGECIIQEKDNFIIGVIGDYSTSDSKNNIWSIIGSNLYKNNNYYAYIGSTIQIACDRLDNLWIIHDLDKLTKIDTKTNTFKFTKTLSSDKIDNYTDYQQRFINFITININNKEEDAAIIIDNNEKVCYILNNDGEEINKVYLLSIPSTFLAKNNYNRAGINFTAYGDFTNYNFQRKFLNKNNFEWKIYTQDNINNLYTKEEIISLAFDVSSYNQGWHYFTLMFDSSRGAIATYVDGILIKKLNFEPFTKNIKNSNKPYCIGAVTTPQGILNDLIGINDTFKFKGLFANLHIYKYSFDIYDINSLYRGTYLNMYKDLLWNINVGNRNYIEQIDKFFMHKMPGSKSKFFNIKINNFKANAQQKEIIEQAIQTAINRIMPAENILNKIKWD